MGGYLQKAQKDDKNKNEIISCVSLHILFHSQLDLGDGPWPWESLPRSQPTVEKLSSPWHWFLEKIFHCEIHKGIDLNYFGQRCQWSLACYSGRYHVTISQKLLVANSVTTDSSQRPWYPSLPSFLGNKTKKRKADRILVRRFRAQFAKSRIESEHHHKENSCIREETVLGFGGGEFIQQF